MSRYKDLDLCGRLLWDRMRAPSPSRGLSAHCPGRRLRRLCSNAVRTGMGWVIHLESHFSRLTLQARDVARGGTAARTAEEEKDASSGVNSIDGIHGVQSQIVSFAMCADLEGCDPITELLPQPCRISHLQAPVGHSGAMVLLASPSSDCDSGGTFLPLAVLGEGWLEAYKTQWSDRRKPPSAPARGAIFAEGSRLFSWQSVGDGGTSMGPSVLGRTGPKPYKGITGYLIGPLILLLEDAPSRRDSSAGTPRKGVFPRPGLKNNSPFP